MTLYIPITVGGFFVYGEEVNTNVTLSLSKSLFVNLGNILMAIHLVFAFLIVMNPVCQDVEEAFDIPKSNRANHLIIFRTLSTHKAYLQNSCRIDSSTICLLTHGRIFKIKCPAIKIRVWNAASNTPL